MLCTGTEGWGSKTNVVEVGGDTAVEVVETFVDGVNKQSWGCAAAGMRGHSQ